MSTYAEVLRRDDPRIAKIFDVEEETRHSGSTVIDDPFPGLKALLERGPVHKGALGDLLGYDANAGFQFHIPGHVTYTALSFNAVNKALTDNLTYSSEGYNLFAPQNALWSKALLFKVGEEHRCQRGSIQPIFSPESAETWWTEKTIAETVDVLVSKVEGKGKADLFLEICARMPTHVVSTAFGVEPDDIMDFRVAMLGSTEHHATPEERQAHWRKSVEILKNLIDARRKAPRDDIITRLTQAKIEYDDGRTRSFTDEEIIQDCQLVLLAGGGTTWRQLGITLFALLNNPEQLEAVKADRSLLPNAVLESARWHPTDLVFPRRVEKNVTLEGVDIPAGAILHMCFGAANRDPKRWDSPETFDISRKVQRSTAFGGGPHSCLGQHVSRQEMVQAMNAIFDRLPNLRWDPSAPPAKLTGGLFQRGPSALPVVFD